MVPTDDSLEELSVDDCWRLVRSRSVGRLAVSVEDGPDVFPVNYRIDDETIVIKTAPGMKFSAASHGERVAFEIDSIDELNHAGWSVVVHGTATEIDDPDELLDADRLIIEPWARGPKPHYVRVAADRVTGRRLPDLGARVPFGAPRS